MNTMRHNVAAALVYDDWFKGFPASWIKLGELEFQAQAPTIGRRVSVYATEPGESGAVMDALEAFVPSLPPSVVFKPVETGTP